MMILESYCPSHILDKFRAVEMDESTIELMYGSIENITFTTLEIDLDHTWDITKRPPEYIDDLAKNLKLQ
jgi:hypothetical protein